MKLQVSRHDIERSLTALPAFPRVVLDILDALNDDNASTATLASHVQHDPVIAGRVLSATHRAAQLGQRRVVKDLYAAVSLLGLQRIREIVLTANLADFTHLIGAEGSFWEHSLAVSIAAQELGNHCGLNPNYALIAGLLHDIGLLWLTHYQAETQMQIGEALARHPTPRHDVERATFGMDHCEIGYHMARGWHLPEEICQSIAQHHQPDTAQTSSLVAVTHLAENICNGLDIPQREQNRVTHIADNAFALAGIKPEQELAGLLGRIEARYLHARALFMDEMSEAANRESCASPPTR